MADAMEVDQAKPQRFQVKKVRIPAGPPSSALALLKGGMHKLQGWIC
jgi:hypothetical protein